MHHHIADPRPHDQKMEAPMHHYPQSTLAPALALALAENKSLMQTPHVFSFNAPQIQLPRKDLNHTQAKVQALLQIQVSNYTVLGLHSVLKTPTSHQ
jgi:hypothetical protein